jgi:Protein of unknown function (DUF3455)
MILLTAILAPYRAWGNDASWPTPKEIAPPDGNTLFLTTEATGTQNYICLPSQTAGSTTWTLMAPQATLSWVLPRLFERQVATHFLSPVPDTRPSATFTEAGCSISNELNEVNCPSWQSSLDSSIVWGGKVGSIAAGSDPSCPNTGAIPCLLLKAVRTKGMHHDGGILTKTTFIQRLHTRGGSAPTAACEVGERALVPYTAEYLFFQGAEDLTGSK